jgi:lactoylglutathione lyase
MEIIAIALLVLRCSDIERSRLFYESLGLHFVAEKHGSGRAHYSTRIGSTVLELYPETDAETHGLRIGFSVVDLPTIIQVIERNGGSSVRVALHASPPHAVIRDPDGHWIELTQATEKLDEREGE